MYSISTADVIHDVKFIKKKHMLLNLDMLLIVPSSSKYIGATCKEFAEQHQTTFNPTNG